MYWSKLAGNIQPYVPGEQPRVNMIKLNTNENPYPPSPQAIEAMREAVNGDLRLYPDPENLLLREAIASVEGLRPENVFVGNGSDEVLALSFLAFCDPDARPSLRYPDISYSFYPVYAALYGMTPEEILLNADFSLPVEAFYGDVAPILIANPNAPTSIAMDNGGLRRILLKNPSHAVMVDEAYAAFAPESAAALLGEFDNLLVTRTFSKSHSLAGLRVGYALGSAHMIEALNRIKNSFNSYPVDRVAQAGAAAAILDTAYNREVIEKILATRERVTKELRIMGFDCPDSHANFLFAAHATRDAGELMAGLRERGILVRRFQSNERTSQRLRISVGTDGEMDALLTALKEIL